MLVISMCALKHGQQQDFTAKLFKNVYCTRKRQVNKYLKLTVSFIFENFVLKSEKMWTMLKLRNDARTFKRFDHARLSMNVISQQSNCPSGNMVEGKKYFSGKNKLYGYMKELLILPIGICSGCTKYYPGSVLDLQIFLQYKNFLHEAPRNVLRDLDVQDQGLLQEMQHDYWAFLADKNTREQQSLSSWWIPKRFTKIHLYCHPMKQQIVKFRQIE